ncbi:hypothetical protein ACFLQN_04515 [Candidatus Aenigmatarchaeota archaeon]
MGGGILIAIGFFLAYFSIEESDHSDSSFLIMLLIGIAMIIAGGWIIAIKITFAVLLRKIAGFILAAVGLFMLVGFPDIVDYQRRGFTKSAMVIGLFLLVIGVYFLFF